MKRCSYCGKEYPDDATVCDVDGQPLADAVQNGPNRRSKVSGVWRGAYGYGELRPDKPVVSFTLRLKQGWFGHFSGSVVEDAPDGMPGIGQVDGFLDWPGIGFTKQMPIGYIATPGGSRITLREYFIEHGQTCGSEFPSPPIQYKGTFLDANRVQGYWVIRPARVSLPNGWGITLPQSVGLWCAQFSASDADTIPAEAPQQPYFDRTLVPKPEELADANRPFRSLGKFSVADAESFVRQFDAQNIRFEMGRDDVSMRAMTPFTASLGGYYGTATQIEIYVHPDDETKAKAIIDAGSML